MVTPLPPPHGQLVSVGLLYLHLAHLGGVSFRGVSPFLFWTPSNLQSELTLAVASRMWSYMAVMNLVL